MVNKFLGVCKISNYVRVLEMLISELNLLRNILKEVIVVSMGDIQEDTTKDITGSWIELLA